MRLLLGWSFLAILSIVIGCSSDVGSTSETDFSRQLETQDIHARLESLASVRASGDLVVSRLQVAIKNDDAVVRTIAVEAAAAITDAALEMVRAALEDREPSVREACAAALKSLTSETLDLQSEVDRSNTTSVPRPSRLDAWLGAYFGHVHSAGPVAGLVIVILTISIAAVNITKLRHAHRERLALIEKGLQPNSQATPQS